MACFRCSLMATAVCLASNVYGLKLQGALAQGSLVVGYITPGLKLEVMGRKIRVDDNGLYVFGLGRNAPSEITLTTFGDKQKNYIFPVLQREYKEDQVFGVPQKTVTPPIEVIERIRKEAAAVRLARNKDIEILDFLSGFRLPLEGRITGVYGSRRVYNGSPGSPHYGLDIAAPVGASVYAPASGVVELVDHDMFYSGGTLIINHGRGVSSTFIHLSEVLLSVGQKVNKGDLIAKVGATGRASGPHLDWRINWFEVRLDPELVLKYLPSVDG
jgi:murein DD-endopeptidase MepM/ murein hydrolase activator NlpD